MKREIVLLPRFASHSSQLSSDCGTNDRCRRLNDTDEHDFDVSLTPESRTFTLTAADVRSPKHSSEIALSDRPQDIQGLEVVMVETRL